MFFKMAIRVCLLLLCLTSTVYAEQKKILVVKTMDVPIIELHVSLFLDQFKQLAEQHGVKYSTRTINAKGDAKYLSSQLDRQLSGELPDIIVTSATLGTQVTFKHLRENKISNTGQVYFTVTDPWGAGVIDGNSAITGVPYYLPSDIKIGVANRLIPDIKNKPLRIGYIYSTYPSAIADFKRIEQAVKDGPVTLHSIKIDYQPIGLHRDEMLDEVKQKLVDIEADIDYWWLAKGPLGESPETVSAIAEKSSKPVLYGNSRASVENGAVFYANVSDHETAKVSARLALDFLLGKKPEKTSQAVLVKDYELYFNVDSATAAGLIIPSDLLQIAIKNKGIITR